MALFKSVLLPALVASTTLANPLPTENPGADRCAITRCPGDTICVNVNGRAECVPRDRFPPEPCGDVVCTGGLKCCNPSCGECAPPGVACLLYVCDRQCGAVTCPPGTTCCNKSCGICTRPFGPCDDKICKKKPPLA